MKQNAQSAHDIAIRLRAADDEEFAVLERSLAADTRKTVKAALASTRRRLAAQAEERTRIERLYLFQERIGEGGIVVGLDEVGRGPLAGPLTVGAVVLPPNPRIEGLNDSKQVAPELREQLAVQIKQVAIAWSVQHIQPDEIDAAGMTASLRVAFSRAVKAVEQSGCLPQTVLLDGNPLHMDPREVNVVKGDARCASIAAASIIAKVERDAIMVDYARTYPEYGFEKNKGYGSAEHRQAIGEYGLCPIHRVSFCSAFTQDTLF